MSKSPKVNIKKVLNLIFLCSGDGGNILHMVDELQFYFWPNSHEKVANVTLSELRIRWRSGLRGVLVHSALAELASNWELLDNRGVVARHKRLNLKMICRCDCLTVLSSPVVQRPSPATDVISNITLNKYCLKVWKLRKCFIILACWFSSVYFICIEKQKDIWDECYDGGGYDRTAARRNITCLPDNGLSVAQTFTRNLNLTLGMFSLPAISLMKVNTKWNQ